MHVSRDSPDMTPYFSEKGASVKIHLGEICNVIGMFSVVTFAAA